MDDKQTRCPTHNVPLEWDESTTEEVYTGFGFSTRTYRVTRYACPFYQDGCREMKEFIDHST